MKKILPTRWERIYEDKLQQDVREPKQFWSKIRKHKEHNRKANWINDMKKGLQRFEEDLEEDIHLESLWAALKKVLNRKTPGQDSMHEWILV